jgi:hypothetical protein
MSIFPISPRATLILTRLQYADWSSTLLDKLEWISQRCLFGPHPDGVDSHLAIRFQFRTDAMIDDASRQDVSSLAASDATDVVWEVVQDGKSGFRSYAETWGCAYRTPTQFHYEFSVADPSFVIFMHRACVRLIANGVQYGANLRYNATICRWWPWHCCEPPEAVNCVSSVLLAIASGLRHNTQLATDYSWDTAKFVLHSSVILAAYTPDLAVAALIRNNIVKEHYHEESTSSVLSRLCRKRNRAGALPSLPSLMMLRT